MPRRFPASANSVWRAAVFLLKVLPNLPSWPVDWLTAEPVVEQVRYPAPDGGTVEADLYRPGKRGSHPGIVVCLGVVPFETDHPQVPRLGEALARAGFAALLFWSPAMRDLRLDPVDVEGIALAYDWLVARPDVEPARSGLLGTCVGGSFALLAAAHPRIRARVAFVFAWAPYASMRLLARDIASASCEGPAGREPWAVDQLTRKVFVRTFTAGLPAMEAEAMRTACAERAPKTVVPGLSPAGEAIHPLMTALETDAAATAVESLPPDILATMDAMSPDRVAADIQARLISLAHDRDDAVIPIGQSRALTATIRAAGRPVHATEFRMFKHLDPTKVRLAPLALARELARFYRMIFTLFRAPSAS